ncbi:MAG: hypothetical protein II661_01790, partial [Bacteroidales bacterium]|nr:hypothetical protein [Bacteroidales bacterium]
LSAFKADNKRTSSGQQADNNRRWSCNVLVFNGRFSGVFGLLSGNGSQAVNYFLRLSTFFVSLHRQKYRNWI